MAKIINKATSTVVNTLPVDGAKLGTVLLQDAVRPLLDRETGDHLRSKFTGLPVWIATLQIPKMASRDTNGAAIEVQLRMEGDQVNTRIDAPCFVKLTGNISVTATNASASGERRGRLTLKADGIVETDEKPGTAARSGIPVILPTLRWVDSAPAKGFGGTPRVENGQPVHIVSLMTEERAVTKDGETFVARGSMTVEVVGDPNPDDQFTALDFVSIPSAGAQVLVDDFGRTARLTVTASQVNPAAAPETAGGPVVSAGRRRQRIEPVEHAEQPVEVPVD